MSDYAKYLNADIDFSKSEGTICQLLRDAILSGAVTPDNFKAYLADYASALTAAGGNKDSIKAMKYQRSYVFKYAFAMHKAQAADPELWTIDASTRILAEKVETSGSLSQLYKALKETLADEKPPKEFDLEAELAKLIQKAQNEGLKPNAIKSALNKQAKEI